MVAVHRLGLLGLPELLVVLAVAVLLFGARDRFGRDMAQGISRFRYRMEQMQVMREFRWQPKRFQSDPTSLAIIMLLCVLVVLLVTLVWLHAVN